MSTAAPVRSAPRSLILGVLGNIFLILAVPILLSVIVVRAWELRPDYQLLLTGKYSRQEAEYRKFAKQYGIPRLAWEYFRSYAETIVSASDEAVDYAVKYHHLQPSNEMLESAYTTSVCTFAYLTQRMASEGTALENLYNKLATETLLLFTAKHFRLSRENINGVLEVYAEMKKVYDQQAISPPKDSPDYLNTPLEKGFIVTLKRLGLNTDDPEILRNSVDIYGHWVTKSFGAIAEAHQSLIRKVNEQTK